MPVGRCEVSSAAFAGIADGLANSAFAGRARLLIEKPFGTDLSSARALRSCLEAQFSSAQIFAVDHYLEKSVVQSLSLARHDAALDAHWNSEHIKSVEIVMAEGFGIEGVDPSSMTETYVRANIRIHNDRWRNVAFRLVSGKALAESRISVTVSFRESPSETRGKQVEHGNELVIELAPIASASVYLPPRPSTDPTAEKENEVPSTVPLHDDEEMGPYARMFDDAFRGEHRWFARSDVVAESWRVVQHVLDHAEPSIYEFGSWGPAG